MVRLYPFWSGIQATELAAVATSGAYGDLTSRPTLGTAAAQNATAFATAAQGVKADGAVQSEANSVDLSQLLGGVEYAIDIAGQAARAVSGGRVTLAGGSAADPALRIGDAGIYQSASNTLSVAIAGVERLRITSSGITVYGTVTTA